MAAAADYSQRDYPVAAAVDGDLGTGWAVDGHVLHDNRNAFFAAREPFGFEGGTRLVVRLRQHFGYQHTIGRFRLSVAADPALLAGTVGLEWGDWQQLGPIKGDPDALFVRDPDGLFGQPGGIDTARPVGEQSWSVPDLVDGEPLALKGGNRAFYFLREVTAREACTVSLSLGSDDSIVAWVNGRRVLSNNAKRGVAADQELLNVGLEAGVNQLLFKVVNYGGPAGFYFRADGTGPATLPGEVTAALALPAERRDERQRAALRDHFRRRHLPEWSAWTARIDDLDLRVREIEASAPALMVMRDDPSARMTHVLERGQYDQLGQPVTADVPAFLPPIVPRAGEVPDRLDLARWMVDPAPPAHRPGGGQPRLADAVRHRPGGHAGGLRVPGRVSLAPAAPGPPGPRPGRRRVGPQGVGAAHRPVLDLPPELGGHRRGLRSGPEQPAPGPRAHLASAGGDGARRRPVRLRPADRGGGRAQRAPVPAGGGCGRRSPSTTRARSAPTATSTPPTPGRTCTGGACTPSGSAPCPRRPCRPSTRPPARCARCAAARPTRRSRLWS